MFGKNKKDESRNTRRTVWKPEPKPDLLAVAGKNNQQSDKNKSFRQNIRNPQRRQIFEENNNTAKYTENTSSNSELFSEGHQQRLSSLKAKQMQVFRSPSLRGATTTAKSSLSSSQLSSLAEGEIKEEAFSSSYSDIASEEVEKNPSDVDKTNIHRKITKEQTQLNNTAKKKKSKSRISEKEQFAQEIEESVAKYSEKFDESLPQTPYRKIRLIAVILTLFFLVFTYFFEAWSWQYLRANKLYLPLEKDIPIVVKVRKDEIIKSGVTEEIHFRTLERILNSYPLAVGFYGSLANWLPISNDPLQIARVNQLLIRYPNVLVSADSRYKVNNTNANQKNTTDYAEQNKFSYKSEVVSKLRAIEILEPTSIFDKAMNSVNVGFKNNNEYFNFGENLQLDKVKKADIATNLILANLDEKSSSELNNAALSFPLMLAVIANGQKPQDFRLSEKFTGVELSSAKINISLNKKGEYAGAINLGRNFPDAVEWHNLVKAKRSEFIELFKNRSVIIGLDNQMVYLPQRLIDGERRALGFFDIFKLQIAGEKLIAIPAILWQANLFTSLSSGFGIAKPNILLNGYLALAIIFLLTFILWYSKNNFRKLMLMLLFIIIGLFLQYTLKFSQINAVLYAILILPFLFFSYKQRLIHRQVMDKWHIFMQDKINKEPPISLFTNEKKFPDDLLSDKKKLDKNINYQQEVTLLNDYFEKKSEEKKNVGALKENLFTEEPLSFKQKLNENIEKSRTAGLKPTSAVPLQEAPLNSEIPGNNIIHRVEREIYNQDVKSYQDETNPFTNAILPTEYENIAQLNHSNNTSNLSSPVHRKILLNSSGNVSEEIEKADWQDNWDWDENQRLVKNIANRLENQAVESANQKLKEAYEKPDTVVKKTDTALFNKVLVENLEDEENSESSQLRIGRYLVEKVLGKGAMGVVYLGLDPHIERKVAIKTVPLPAEDVAGENEILTKKFFREAQAAGRLTHPGIVTIYDAGLYQKNVYMAMEFLEGADLSNFIRADQLLPLVTVLSITARVAEALHFAHEHGVIHRDIKPANIIFNSSQNTVKVTDFGIAHIHDSNRAMTQVLVGSPNYMSPEHFTGETLDGRSDLFSLGVTLYVLCSGATPFYADNVSKLMYSIINEEPRDIRHFNPKVPDTVVQIINKVLAKDRNMRYISGAAFAQDLLFALKQVLNYQ